MCFVQPHNQAIPILGRFHRLYYDVRALCLYKSVDPRFIVGYSFCRYARPRCDLLLTSCAYYRNVEFVGTPYALGLPPISYMRQEAIGEAVQAFICMSIRIDTRLKKRQANNIIVNIMPILTIIKQADTVSPFAQINPAMSTDLKTGHIPGRVTMRGALNAAKLDFIACSCAVDCQWKRRFQQRQVFVPVDLGGNIDARRVAPERNTLRDTRGHVRTDNLDGSTHRSLFDDMYRCYISYRVRLLLVKEIDIPGIEIQGTILISNKLVAWLPGSKNITFCTYVVELADLSLRIDAEVIILIVQDDCLRVGKSTLYSVECRFIGHVGYLFLTGPRIAGCRNDPHSAWGNAHTIQQEHRVPLPVSCLLGGRVL